MNGEDLDEVTRIKILLVKKVWVFVRLCEAIYVVILPAFIATAFWPWVRNRFIYTFYLGQFGAFLICMASCVLIKY